MTEHDNINSELHSLDREAQELDAKIDADLRNMQKVVDEFNRMADVAHIAPKMRSKFDREFDEKTSLDKLDVAILFVAAAIQCVRWYFLDNNKYRLTAQEGDKMMGTIIPKNWHDILLTSVPYDAIAGGAELGAGLGGMNHRYKTLGHDPIAGWIFGPVNILSDSLTKNDFTSYKVNNMIITRSIPTTEVFRLAYDQIRADKLNLPAAIARHAIHLGSDFFTELSLPVPFAGMTSDNAAKWLTRNHIDMWSITRNVTLAGFINLLVAWFHRLFYDPAKYGSPDVYEVKTQKIIYFSNLIATSGNLLYTATGDLSRIDIGGMLVTLWTRIHNRNFKQEVKREFIAKKLNDMIRGEGKVTTLNDKSPLST